MNHSPPPPKEIARALPVPKGEVAGIGKTVGPDGGGEERVAYRWWPTPPVAELSTPTDRAPRSARRRRPPRRLPDAAGHVASDQPLLNPLTAYTVRVRFLQREPRLADPPEVRWAMLIRARIRSTFDR